MNLCGLETTFGVTVPLRCDLPLVKQNLGEKRDRGVGCLAGPGSFLGSQYVRLFTQKVGGRT